MEGRPQRSPCFTRESQQNSRAQLSGKRASLRELCRCFENYCEGVFVLSPLLFPDKQRLITTGNQTAPWTSTAPNRTSCLALRVTGKRECEQCVHIPEPHPCTSPGKWFLWALWRSSRLCRSSGYRSHPRAGSGGNTSSWKTEAESRNRKKGKKQMNRIIILFSTTSTL